MNKTKEKNSLLLSRVYNMKIMKYCLERYKETQDIDFWEWAKVFGDWSKLNKKQIEQLK